VAFNKYVRNYADLGTHLDVYSEQGDAAGYSNMQRLIATADGRYDFSTHNLNDRVGREVEPIRFRRWLERVWSAYVASVYGASGSGSASGSNTG